MIVAYKDQNERRLAPLLARHISEVVPPDWHDWADAVSYIPSDRATLRRRGFDHMQQIASSYAACVGLPLASLLLKQRSTNQRVLGRASRAQNMATAFLAAQDASGAPKPSKKILLLDDVFTTGATLDAAAATLRAAGVEEVRVATIARVW
jgi:predicted amidophosphoribosyltransferase